MRRLKEPLSNFLERVLKLFLHDVPLIPTQNASHQCEQEGALRELQGVQQLEDTFTGVGARKTTDSCIRMRDYSLK